MRLLRTIICVAALSGAGLLHAEPVCDASFESLDQAGLQKLTAALQQNKIVRSTYTQNRVIHLLKKPLLAEGNMIFAPGEGLYWQVVKPFPYELVMTPTRFVQKSGAEVQVISAKEQPAIFAISSVFSDLLGGNIQAAIHYFSVAGKKNAEGQWSLCLQPQQEPFSRLMAYIRIDGTDTIQAVHLQDVGNDYTDITFHADLSRQESLTDAEKAHFTSP